MVVMPVMTVSMRITIMMMMPVIVVVIMVMAMIVNMAMIMSMVMPVLMMVDALMRATAARVFAEQQRLDRDRHGERRHADAAEIDVVEVAQHHAVDGQDLALDQQLLAQDRPERLGDVAVEHEIDRLLALDGGGETAADAVGEGGNALVGRRAEPAQRQRHLALAFDQIEGGEMRADGRGELVRLDHLLAHVRGLQHLQIAARKQHARFRDIAGVAAELYAVFGRPERGGADALTGRQ